MLLYNPTPHPVNFHEGLKSLRVEPISRMFDLVTGEIQTGIFIVDAPDNNVRFKEYVKMEMLDKFFVNTYKGTKPLPVYKVSDDTFYDLEPPSLVGVGGETKKSKEAKNVADDDEELEEEDDEMDEVDDETDETDELEDEEDESDEDESDDGEDEPAEDEIEEEKTEKKPKRVPTKKKTPGKTKKKRHQVNKIASKGAKKKKTKT